jgi:hypothetical protein
MQDDLAALADPERAALFAPYLGTVPGGYGEGDVLLGIPVPAQRRVARRARDLPLDEAATLLESPVHEHRFVALVVLVERHRRAGGAARAELSAFYLDHRAGGDNWDLVDASARQLVGEQLHDGPRTVLGELAGSERLWDRRIAVVSTHALILRDELSETFSLAERLMDDPHHLMGPRYEAVCQGSVSTSAKPTSTPSGASARSSVLVQRFMATRSARA